MLQQALNRRVIVHENGRQRRIRLQDAILQGLVNDAARRNHNALRLLFSLLERYGQSSDTAINLGELTVDDSAIIERYVSILQRASGDTSAGQMENSGTLGRQRRGRRKLDRAARRERK